MDPKSIYYTILYYTILYYTILYYTILYYTILYYTILYYTILYYTILYYTILYYTILYYTILYYTILLDPLVLKVRCPRPTSESLQRPRAFGRRSGPGHGQVLRGGSRGVAARRRSDEASSKAVNLENPRWPSQRRHSKLHRDFLMWFNINSFIKP